MASASGCSVVLQAGMLANGTLAPAIVRAAGSACKRFVVISDRNVAELHLAALTRSLAAIHCEAHSKVLPPGDLSKCRRTKEEIEDWMAGLGCGRDTCVVALGGGVVQDICAFVAATYMMTGVALVGVPTSLVAMIECSTPRDIGLDTPGGKNLVGAHVVPRAVFADLELLRTLSPRHLRNGVVSALRSAIVYDRALFDLIDENAHSLQQFDMKLLSRVVHQTIQGRLALLDPGRGREDSARASVVGAASGGEGAQQQQQQQQQVEPPNANAKANANANAVNNTAKSTVNNPTGSRAKLREVLWRLGSTVGGALQDLMSPMLLEGECLAIGLMTEMELAGDLGYLKDAAVTVGRVRRCLKKFALATDIPADLESRDLVATIRAMHEQQQEAKKDAAVPVPPASKAATYKIGMVSAIGTVVEPDPVVAVGEAALARILASSQDAVAVAPTRIHGTISVPGSKSISIRVLLLAALGTGSCRVRGLLLSEATETMVIALRKLGVRVEWEGPDMRTLIVHGSGGRLALPDSELYMGSSASTPTRFLTTAVNLVEAKGRVVITGTPRMHEQPITDLVDALGQSGCRISYIHNQGSLPLRVDLDGSGWAGGPMHLAANVSSQFVSSVIMSAPYAKAPITLSLEEKAQVVSRQYIDITLRVMELFGVRVRRVGSNQFAVPQQAYVNPKLVVVEGDATFASYPLALAAVTGGTVTVDNVGSRSMQADARFCKLLERMGCGVRQTETTTTLSGPRIPVVAGADGEVEAVEEVVEEAVEEQEEQEGNARTGGDGETDGGVPNGSDEKLATAGRAHHNGQLVAVPEAVDMGGMADLFMTLAAVAAFARGTTVITNIGNQRYKDCNRLEVMVSQLRGLGVACEELKDGVRIQGNPKLRNRAVRETTFVDPHEDSRVAMSFAVLGSAAPGVAIESKRCVDAFYPSFWKDLELRLNGKVGPVLDPVSTHIPQSEATIWLVGMRGVGKSTLGRQVAKTLGRAFIDLDQIFEIRHGVKIRAFVQRHSFRAFRARELEIFLEVIKTHARGFVVACGAGLVETSMAMEAFKRLPVVVQVNRHIDDVAAYLSKDSTRPALLKDGKYAWDCHAIWRARKELYRAASSYEFTIVRGDTAWPAILDDLTRFLQTITMSPVGRASSSEQDVADEAVAKLVGGTFFLSLTFPHMSEAVPIMQDLVAGNSAIELRVDLWRSWEPEFIKEQIATFRRHCCLPIVYTVRTEGQCGKFPDDEKALFRLYELGIRLGCEYVDMEHHWSRAARNKLMRHRRHSKIIASAHFKGSNGGTEMDLENTFRLCAHGGRADVVKVVTTAFCLEDAIRLVHVAKNVVLPGNPPKIILAMGAVGQISRVFNEFLTPVTHALMPGIAAPGQLSIAEIMTSRRMLSIRAPLKRQMYVIGQEMKMSLAPLLFNTAFKYLHLDHEAKISDTKDASLDSIVKLFKSPTFGGATISTPFKSEVIPLLSRMSSSAKAIGAVNAVAVLEDGSLYGHNTDWSAFYKKLQAERLTAHDRNAVVVGSCGTARAACYALLSFGYQHENIIVFDPTNPKKAAKVAKHFKCQSSEDLKHVRNINIVIASFRKFGSKQLEEFTLPLNVVRQCPLVIDSRYYPLHTKLEDQAAVYGCNTLTGLDLLILQSIQQLKLWVGVEHWAMVESAAPVIDRAVRHLYYQQYVTAASSNESKS